MLKRAFILSLLTYLISTLTVLSLTEHVSSVPTSAVGLLAVKSEGLICKVDAVNPILHFLHQLFTSADGQDNKQRRDNFSDFFRIRKYNFRFLLWEDFFEETRTPLAVVSVPSDQPYQPAYFAGLATLPNYYRLLFRLTPF